MLRSNCSSISKTPEQSFSPVHDIVTSYCEKDQVSYVRGTSETGSSMELATEVGL